MTTGAATGGLLGAAIASKVKRKDDGEMVSDEGIAASIPGGNLILGLTSSGRILVYEQSKLSGKRRPRRRVSPRPTRSPRWKRRSSA